MTGSHSDLTRSLEGFVQYFEVLLVVNHLDSPRRSVFRSTSLITYKNIKAGQAAL